jgi:hypothetical protein
MDDRAKVFSAGSRIAGAHTSVRDRLPKAFDHFESRRFSPPGRLYEVNGRVMHLSCAGATPPVSVFITTVSPVIRPTMRKRYATYCS